MRRKIVAGNWKMNGSKALAQTLVSDVQSQTASLDNGVEVVIIPPAIYVGDVIANAGGSLSVGVQNVGQWSSGAYTGEISAEMAVDQGCQYALIGHSERRQVAENLVVEQQVRLVDLVPTLASYVGVELSRPVHGRSLVPLLSGNMLPGL